MFKILVVKKSGNVFSLINDNTITGSYLNTYCVYTHPNTVQTWIEVLENDLRARATRLADKCGVQIGSPAHAVYVNVYDNDSIESQGCMGLYYGTHYQKKANGLGQ